ncbi:hypothetical protein D3C73_464400 [compost metagenome]
MVDMQANHYLQRWGSLTLLALLELVVFFPLVVVIQAYVMQTPLWLTFLQLWIFYIIGLAGGASQWLSRTIYEVLYALVLGSVLSLWLQGTFWQGWLSSIIGIFLIMRGIRLTRNSWSQLFPVTVYIMGLLVYLLAVPIMGRMELFKPYAGLTNFLGFISLIIFFFYFNRIQLTGATLSTSSQAFSSLSASVRSINRLWIIVIILLIGIIGFFQQIKDGFTSMLRSIIMFLISLIPKDQPAPEPSPAASAPPPELPPMVPSEPSWLAVLLEKLFMIIGYTLLAVLIIAAVYMIFKRLAPILIKAIRKLLSRLRFVSEEADQAGYSDEQELVVEWRELPGAWLKGLTNRLLRKGQTELRWSQLKTNRERVRFLYRGLVRQATDKGHNHNQAYTPNESGRSWITKDIYPAQSATDITSAYNRVRYGNEEISDDEMKKLIAEAESILKHIK